ncbi:hypothetical protein AAG570_001492 [Ranatra chinensis]|uniref:Uncharacterized protein n=1 Tax=Ranatra chinensis TaxID=642074 RepID=A0ABD0YX07_9HEMI
MAKKGKKNKQDSKKEKKTETQPSKVVEPPEEIWYRGQLQIKSEQVMQEAVEEDGGPARSSCSAPALRTWVPGPPPIRKSPFAPAASPQQVPAVSVWKFIDSDDTPLAAHMTREEAVSLMEHRLPDWFSDQNILVSRWLQYEVLRWALGRKFNHAKVSSLLSIFCNTHVYFCRDMWKNQEDVYYFFKESILLHTILDPPKSAAIFEPSECRDGLLLFCRLYLPYLPLLRLLLVPTYRLQLAWQTPPPKTSQTNKQKKTSKKK